MSKNLNNPPLPKTPGDAKEELEVMNSREVELITQLKAEEAKSRSQRILEIQNKIKEKYFNEYGVTPEVTETTPPKESQNEKVGPTPEIITTTEQVVMESEQTKKEDVATVDEKSTLDITNGTEVEERKLALEKQLLDRQEAINKEALEVKEEEEKLLQRKVELELNNTTKDTEVSEIIPITEEAVPETSIIESVSETEPEKTKEGDKTEAKKVEGSSTYERMTPEEEKILGEEIDSWKIGNETKTIKELFADGDLNSNTRLSSLEKYLYKNLKSVSEEQLAKFYNLKYHTKKVTEKAPEDVVEGVQIKPEIEDEKVEEDLNESLETIEKRKGIDAFLRAMSGVDRTKPDAGEIILKNLLGNPDGYSAYKYSLTEKDRRGLWEGKVDEVKQRLGIKNKVVIEKQVDVETTPEITSSTAIEQEITTTSQENEIGDKKERTTDEKSQKLIEINKKLEELETQKNENAIKRTEIEKKREEIRIKREQNNIRLAEIAKQIEELEKAERANNEPEETILNTPTPENDSRNEKIEELERNRMEDLDTVNEKEILNYFNKKFPEVFENLLESKESDANLKIRRKFMDIKKDLDRKLTEKELDLIDKYLYPDFHRNKINKKYDEKLALLVNN